MTGAGGGGGGGGGGTDFLGYFFVSPRVGQSDGPASASGAAASGVGGCTTLHVSNDVVSRY
jgi:hypothetical protein